MIAQILKSQFDTTLAQVFPGESIPEYTLEHPVNADHGDYACNIAMVLSKALKQKPRDIAEKIVAAFPKDEIESISIAGPGFINVFLKNQRLIQEVEEILSKKKQYGANLETPKKIMLEYAQPNTNKPQHVGHMRNAFYGKTVNNLLTFVGHEVILVSYFGDVGVHIMKSMLAYQKWGKGQTPEDEGLKSDHFVGKYYVMFTRKVEEDESLMQEAQAMLQKWEAGDPEVRALWKKMNDWAYEGWDVTFDRMDVTFDEKYYESQYTDKGKEIAKETLTSGIAKEAENGAIIVDLSAYNLGEKVLLRGDGTSVYMTKELALFKDNYEKYHMDLRLYVVGSDQDHYFRQFFKILELLGHDYGKGGHHLSYGMVRTKAGKMSSREGTVINADDMMDEAHALAEQEIASRHADISDDEKDISAEAIGVGSLKYALLRVDAVQDVQFNPEEAISFEGNTGPYLQYTYARIQSILRKAGKIKKTELVYTEPSEILLLRTLYQFPETVLNAARDYKPHILCNYLFDLAQKFNGFYANVQVLKGSDSEKHSRVALISAVAQILENGLTLLGIKPLQKM